MKMIIIYCTHNNNLYVLQFCIFEYMRCFSFIIPTSHIVCVFRLLLLFLFRITHITHFGHIITIMLNVIPGGVPCLVVGVRQFWHIYIEYMKNNT